MSVETESGTTHVDIAIIGAGFSGLGMAMRLRQRGSEDFLVLDRHDDVGGTWWANTYPGCACDVPSHLYSFSFEPNPEWSETYSPQAEIRAYLQRCAREHDLYRSIRLGTTVTDAEWDDDDGRWTLQTSGGPVSARVLIAGMGPLTEPKIPELPGLDRFEGKVFHSARWDHGHDLTGERVAAIGTGASAIQFVPAIRPRVARLHVFQRSAPWVMPHPGRRITSAERRLYRALPAAQKAVRAGTYAGRELFVLGFVKNPRLMRVAEAIARRHMRAQISDPALIEKVTPDYTIGCKRILPSNRWYPALARPNVELHTGGVSEVRERSVVAGDGSEHEVDTIIFGTGFQVTDMPLGDWVRGREGKRLADVWRGSPRAHLGSTIAGFPNLFLLLGPNTGLGHSSMVYMIESQISHVLDALHVMQRRGAAIAEVTPEAQEAYNRELDARMEDTVWNTGCASWYIDATGRNATLWPDWTWRFRRRSRRFDPADHTLLAAAGVPEREAVPA
jgi:cation diffusion facilitator CzcD-associated flavoprotein CzcO